MRGGRDFPDGQGAAVVTEGSDVRVVIVAENASARFGGEAILPLHYFRFLRRRGVPAWLVANARNRDELSQTLSPDDLPCVRFIEDRPIYQPLSHVFLHWKNPLAVLPAGMLLKWLAAGEQRRIVRELVRDEGANLVHQPIPVSPKAVSFVHGVGAPVVIGPMNGAMVYPPGFAHFEKRQHRLLNEAAKRLAWIAHRVVPGKRKAAALLVANERTRQGLPRGLCANVIELVENGVDMRLFGRPVARRPSDALPTFVFVGRLIRLKCVDVLLHALAQATGQVPMRLVVVGGGPERAGLQALQERLGLGDDVVKFTGHLVQQKCADILDDATALVLPSVHECGGAVVLEAMAKGLPVIAVRWGGPADYLDESVGVLVEPTDNTRMAADFARAMLRLAADPALCARLGQAARLRVRERYDWERKIDDVLEIYRGVVQAGAVPARARRI